jgi:three-Cys-motif partner protein
MQLFGGDWTERKLRALDQYLRAYAKALSKTSFQRVYVDGFAGTGYREQKKNAEHQQPSIFAQEIGALADPEPQKFLDGSARMALKVVPAFHKYIFVESEHRKVSELEKLMAEFPALASAIDIREGDANAVIQELCGNWDKQCTRGVLFLDPFGMQTKWQTIESVAKTGCVDTWILFPFAANRLMTRQPTGIPDPWRISLNNLFGTDDWEKRFYKERVLINIFNGDTKVVEKNLTMKGLGAFYHERLRSIFPVVAPNPRMLLTTGNQPLFQLFFAAANRGKGGEIALKIAKHILDHI